MIAWDNWIIPVIYIFILSAAIIPVNEKSDTDLITRFVLALLLRYAFTGLYKRKVAKALNWQGGSDALTNRVPNGIN